MGLRCHSALPGFRGIEWEWVWQSDLVTAHSHWSRKGRNKSPFAWAADQPAAHLPWWFLRLGEKPQLSWLYKAKGGRGLAVHVQFSSSWRLGPMEALHQSPPRAMHSAARSVFSTAGLILPVPRAGHLCSHTCLWASFRAIWVQHLSLKVIRFPPVSLGVPILFSSVSWVLVPLVVYWAGVSQQ